MSDLTLEALATDIRARLDGVRDDLSKQVADQVSDAKLADLVRTQLKAVLEEDPEFVRKVRFGGNADPELVGTKYARLGLGVADVELLYDILRAARDSGLSKQGPSQELERTFQAVSEGRYMSTALARADDERRLLDMHRSGRLDSRGYERALRAMDTAESGYGSQLIGAQYVGELWEAARRDSRVFNLINSFEMTDPTAYLPVEVDFPEMLYVSENTANNSSDYTTVKTGSQRVSVSASKFLFHQMWSGEMEEDSIIPFIPFLRRQLGLGVAHYSDSLVLNGDTTNAATGNINLDDADPADTKHYLAFDGIRHAALVDNTGNAVDAAGAVTYSQLTGLRSKMIDSTRFVDWGHPTNPDDLVYISDPETADKIAMLDEVLTVDKYGQNATILNGEVSRIGRHPHIAAMAMSKTEADGKVSTTANNNTKGQVAAFNRRGFVVGWRRRVMVETERLPARDQTRIVLSMRLGFGRFTPTGAASGIEAASVLYDISL
jgi:HK97 family phage major capsid protein